MSGWEVATWLSIGTLVFGSLAVFGWFLVDIIGVWRRDRARRQADRSVQ